ncbi:MULTISPECIES: DUF7344 domain-containing protein [Halolamina]|uniref:DUF7344 domain-containing protein n=1 Tax=Halolamina pelagica TaxID=699431 RepID=A0A1I5Q986_9EURY|nr:MULTISPECIES: hypothetical protein [Halolamina]NHX35162.1 hypothetical protein [Halolamina sp. R1-12]SFP42898.1 hypothetical protein SAMN05216277_103321 [Halolamina pelagica]
MQLRRNTLPESEIYEVLANRRRRATIQQLSDGVYPTTIELHELSEAVAAAEAGTSPPPRALRESVYSSLHQTHLPKLEELGVVRYDRETAEVSLQPRARDVNVYMSVATPYGITWDEYYRALAAVTLTLVVTSLAGVPLVSAVDPLLWASGSLFVLAASVTAQLWGARWYLVETFRGWVDRLRRPLGRR